MKATLLTQLLLDSKDLFSKDWLTVNSMFFHEDYLRVFSKNCINFHKYGVSKNVQFPYFSEEIAPNLEGSFSFFKHAISEINKRDFVSDVINKNIICSTIQSVSFEHVLLLMGQRQTPATIKTVEGLPMTKKEMLDNSLSHYNKQISVGVRAWEKHIDRTEDSFWGEIKGSPQQKLDKVKGIINNIIDNHTWWNTFYHYKHEIVFEIRIKSGHGIRWSKYDKSLIGFLEPFL
ncbi:hypothetical protein [uncultured Lacinutrix sp.]|uniref:hypothetical protein n=1 Tax=uncultured Lacinutrix sp. TaxID=574032 RepID=UPI00262DC300|nr:hypothetical protein [uncultured Lacinutrix sp.]